MTNNRLYNSQHKQIRIQLHRVLKPGTPCRRCGQPMWPGREPLDLGHPTDGYTGYALEHRRCNRAAGARNANRARRRQPQVNGIRFTGPAPRSYRRKW